MDTVTYPDSRVSQFLHMHFVPVKVSLKDDPEPVREYAVRWTPTVVIADDGGRGHDRIEGYLPPEDFVARLSLGVGKLRLFHGEFAQASQRFEEVADRHRGSEAGAEALYWLGVVRYKQSQDLAQLRPIWQQLAQEYPGSDWAKRTRIPATS